MPTEDAKRETTNSVWQDELAVEHRRAAVERTNRLAATFLALRCATAIIDLPMPHGRHYHWRCG